MDRALRSEEDAAAKLECNAMIAESDEWRESTVDTSVRFKLTFVDKPTAPTTYTSSTTFSK